MTNSTQTEAGIRSAIAGQGRLYLGSMNDALFIIDGHPSPAGTDVGPHVRPGQPKCITSTWPVSAVVVKRLVDDHNAALPAGKQI